MDDLIARLRNPDAIKGDVDGRNQMLDTLTAEDMMREAADKIERMRAALKPFAAVAKHYAPYPADMTDKTVDYPFKLADLRAAADALGHEQKGDRK